MDVLKDKKFITFLLLGLLVRMGVMFQVYHVDMLNHIAWGTYAFEHGVHNIYDVIFDLPTGFQINQPPGTVLIFLATRALFVWIHDAIGLFGIRFSEGFFYPVFLKVPAVVSDIGIGAIIYWFISQYTSKKSAFAASMAYVFNPITIFNSAWWGQTDATINLFGLLAFMLLLRKKLFSATLFFAVSLFIKASLIIFAPIFLILVWRYKFSWQSILIAFLVPFLLVFLITLPFHDLKDPLWLWRVYNQRVVFGSLNKLNENAFSLWALFYGFTVRYSTGISIIGIKASLLGQMLFALTALPFLYKVWKTPDVQTTLGSLVGMGFASFLTLTSMHERYLFPIFPAFAVLLAFRPKLLWLYIVASIIHLTNLYYLWWSPNLPWYRMFLETPYVIQGFILSLYTVFFIFLGNYWRSHYSAESDAVA